MAYFLDTSVIVDCIKGKQSAIDLVESLDGELYSSYICLAELYEGVLRSQQPKEKETGLKTFFKSLSSIFGIDENIANKFGEVRAWLKQKGEVIEDFDIINAATCLVYDLTLVTYNQKHFSRIPHLKLALN